jgi:hypothetical protein
MMEQSRTDRRKNPDVPTSSQDQAHQGETQQRQRSGFRHSSSITAPIKGRMRDVLQFKSRPEIVCPVLPNARCGLGDVVQKVGVPLYIAWGASGGRVRRATLEDDHQIGERVPQRRIESPNPGSGAIRGDVEDGAGIFVVLEYLGPHRDPEVTIQIARVVVGVARQTGLAACRARNKVAVDVGAAGEGRCTCREHCSAGHCEGRAKQSLSEAHDVFPSGVCYFTQIGYATFAGTGPSWLTTCFI